MNDRSCILVDGHVHIHPQFDDERVLDAAASNLEAAARRLPNRSQCVGVLLLAEMQGRDWFGRTRQRALDGEVRVGSWSVSLAGDAETLMAQNGRRPLLIMSGRQIVTAERIEVLALLTCRRFDDGLPFAETLEAIHSAGALVVLPWGAGKWFGRRGRLVRRALTGHTPSRPILAGDNGGRPWCWPRPRIFTMAESAGTVVLPGTDPLPLRDQANRIGSFGLVCEGSLPPQSPAAALRDRLIETSSHTASGTFGRPERVFRFLRNQIRLRLEHAS